jgi:glycosyltransferase involved in cell wall biosynthesis
MNWPLIGGAFLGAIWVWHTVAAMLGMPKIQELSDTKWDIAPDVITSKTTGASAPKVSIIVPARNEERKIADAMKTLMASDYPALEVIAVNDRSTDRTGALLNELAAQHPKRLKVIHVSELPERWLGKTYAMYLAAREAQGEWLLFTDADVFQSHDVLRRAVAYAERSGTDHLVVMPTMLMHTWGERMMIALFQALFIFAQRPWKVADPKARDFIGVGAFNLVRRSAYDAIGGYERFRLAVVDDMKLGEEIKKSGFASDCVFAHRMVQIHWASGAFGVVHNLVKNFFAAMRFNVAIVLVAVLGVLTVFLGPWIGAIFAHGRARAGYVVSLLCVLSVYLGMSRRSGVKPIYFLLQPVATLLMAYTMLLSMVVTLWRGGVVWRGTKYSLDELRRAGT